MKEVTSSTVGHTVNLTCQLGAMRVLPLVLSFIFLHQELAHASPPTVVPAILSLCNPCQVLILGETHKQPESHTLFLDLVKALLVRGKRLLVSLEITTGKQASLNAVMAGKQSPVGIASSTIDSPSYQAMLLALGKMHRDDRDHINVVAIDDLRTDILRDDAMATQLQRHLAAGQYDRAEMLVGNMHAVRKMQWVDDAWRKEPYLTEQLVNAGFRVTSVMQDLDTDCEHLRQPTVYPLSEQQELEAVQKRLQVVQSDPEMDVRKAVDGMVVWECRE